MPRTAWNGYARFCPLARALDVIGERWTLVIVQELLKRSYRYTDLLARLPGIGTSVLADRGRALDGALRELRRWGVGFLADPTADGSTDQHFDVTYVDGIDTVPDAQFQLDIDDDPTTLRFTGGRLHQQPGIAPDPELTVRTTRTFLDRWAAGQATWDDGRANCEVTTEGPERAWPRWLAATGYLLTVEAADA